MARGDKIPKKNYYVTMTDSFMSGWGMSRGRKNKYVVGCDTYKQAEVVLHNAQRRPEMKYPNLTSRKPYYPDNVYVSYRDFKQLGDVWTKYN